MKTVSSPLIALSESGLGCGLTALAFALLLGAVGLGWVVNGLLLALGFVLILPLLAFWGLRWWLKQSLIEGPCPVCGYEFTGFKGQECRCPSCGEALKTSPQGFERLTPPGTIDVEAVEVAVTVLED
ncbi:hypothetical protein [Synechocystis sp. LKSZ1]|uniref:hypothetical protein n=1 Tax=Synechocystis sp. LKSZ1 TaxID=3144951 RepID=UPI00336BB1D6